MMKKGGDFYSIEDAGAPKTPGELTGRWIASGAHPHRDPIEQEDQIHYSSLYARRVVRRKIAAGLQCHQMAESLRFGFQIAPVAGARANQMRNPVDRKSELA